MTDRQKRIFVVSATACVVGFLYALYHIFLFYWYGKRGEMYYAAAPLTDGYVSIFWPRLRELADGYLRITDVNLWEYRNGPTTLFPILTPFLYFPVLLIGGLYGALPLGTFLFAALSFVLLFIISRALTEKFSLSVMFASIFVMSRSLPFLFFPRGLNDLKDLVKFFLPFASTHGSIQKLDFLAMESINPGIATFGPFLIFLLLAIKTQRRKYFVWLGIFYGLLFYTYTFYWIYGTICLGLLGALYLTTRRLKVFLTVVLSSVFGAGISAYFWISYFAARHFAQFGEYIARVEPEISHGFRWSQWHWYIFYAVVVVCMYIYAKKRQKIFIAHFFCILYAAGFIAFNMQVVTGFNLQPDHWHIRLMMFPLGFTLLIALTWLLEKAEKLHFKKVAYGILALVTVSTVVGGVHVSYVLAKQRFESFRMPHGVHESLVWMNRNLPKDAVVVTPSLYMNELFLYYTGAKIFLPFAFSTWAPQEEILERLFITYKLFQISETDLASRLDENPNTISFYDKKDQFHINLYDYIYFARFFNQELDGRIKGDDYRPLPTETRKEILTNYRGYAWDIRDLGKKYRADYIYVGPLETKIAPTDFAARFAFEKVYDQMGVKIYKMKP